MAQAEPTPYQAQVRGVDVHRLQPLLGLGTGCQTRRHSVQIRNPEADACFQLDLSLYCPVFHLNRV